jgi:hypothetical protein
MPLILDTVSNINVPEMEMLAFSSKLTVNPDTILTLFRLLTVIDPEAPLGTLTLLLHDPD